MRIMGAKISVDKEKRREEFRAVFYPRLKTPHGRIALAGSLTGLDPKKIAKWGLAGYALPDFEEITLVAKALGLSLDWLATGDPALPMTAAERKVVELLRGCAPNFPESLLPILKAAQLPPGVRDSLKLIPNIGELQIAPKPVTRKRDHLYITQDRDHNITALTLKAHEAPAPYNIRPVEDRKQPRNTRADFQTYHAIKDEHPARHRRAVPLFLQLAAGPGKELERCEDFHSFREFLPKRGIHAAKVQGYSMIETIRHGETILLEAFDEGQGVTLEALGAGDPKTPFWKVQQHVKDQQIWVLAVNKEEPTLKRVNIFEPRGDWFMTITADNPDTEGYPRPIRAKDEVTFYAKMYGFVETQD